MPLKNDLLLRAARGEKTERPPVWLMRQAGRILPQYRKLRASVSGFKELVSTPELACEVTIQPVDELGVDAAIIFSDILVIPEAMGLDYNIVESVGPRFDETIKTQGDVDALCLFEPGTSLDYVSSAIKLVKRELSDKIPLIGFAGAPWTIMCYMVEGGGSKTFSKARKMLVQNAGLSEALLDKITESTIRYLKVQIEAGADIVQMFDSWAGVLSPDLYKRFALPCIRKICAAISEVPIIVFAKDAQYILKDFVDLECQVVGMDWKMDIAETRGIFPNHSLQGNLDPAVLYGDNFYIREKTLDMLSSYGTGRHICNLGHGVYPDTPLDGVKCFVDTVKSHQYA